MTAESQPSTRRRRLRWLPWLILLAAVGVAAGLIATKPKSQTVVASERAWRVETQSAQPGRYQPSATLYGRIESLWTSQLTAGIAADVLAVEVVDGDSVAEGEALVRLDDRDARLVLAQREAELQQAQTRIATEQRRHQANLEALPREKRLLQLAMSEVRRLQDLVTQQVGAQSSLDQARQAAERQAIALSTRQQAVDEHEARLAEAEAALRRTEALRDQALLDVQRAVVSAPFNGRVIEVMVSPGRRVRVGDPLVRMFDTGAMVVRAQIPNRILPLVRDAQLAGERLTLGGTVDGIPVQAYLRNLAGAAVSSTGGVDGIFQITSDVTQISQGRFVELELTLPPSDGLVALPHEAIYGANRIYIVDSDSRMRGVRVERVGEWTDAEGRAQVLVRPYDLPPDAAIVTTHLPNALDGLLLSVVERG
jgi:multidrug resistance efflux pump